MMQKHIEITRKRVQNFASRLHKRFYSASAPVQLHTFHASGRISYEEAMTGEFEPVQVGYKFAPLWSTHWVRVNLTIPKEWRGQEVHLLWDSASEACVWQAGVPLQGLTGSFNGWQADPIHTKYCITQNAQGGESATFFIEVACNGLFGLDKAAHNPRIGELGQAEIAVFDRDAWALYWDLKVVADMALHLPANTPRGGQALYAANEMVNTILLDDRTTWPAAHAISARFLSARNGDGQHNLSAIGHAHIDTAWLWPIAETKRKSARSFATATRYMDDYPEYKFACSQAQQFAWMKEHYPPLYTRMAEKIRAGQFIPVGGTWVEPDCNIPSGESLVRQFLYGQRFFEAEFGMRCQEFWNPDVFGYSGALPQIMKLAGIRYFLTQKLSWNQLNKPDSHTFLWEGIDGSQILTHFPPADTYNSKANVKEVLYNLSNFKDHERANESYLLFGYGDGGGGPTPAMLEQIGRMNDVDGLPRTEIRTPAEFFARCEADIKDPLVVSGELYFELHRGTYTSQARTKKFNRQSELLLRDVEILSALAWILYGTEYPAAILENLWKLVLTNQFHDIIPGSSISEVYADSAQDYALVLEQASALRNAAQHVLTPQSPSSSVDKVCTFNTLSFPRTEVVDMDDRLSVISAPALGYAVQSPTSVAQTVSVTQTERDFVLENAHLKAVFNRQGGLTSLIHKATERECIEPDQAGNTFVLYEDLPNAWEAWDVDIFHLEKTLSKNGAVSCHIGQTDPLRASLIFEYQLSSESWLRQEVSLDVLSERLDFSCEVDWHEQQKFLKVEFPLNIRAPHATYEIQFGHVQRPTHFNTSYDLARFEVPAQKWADLSEPDFGVALLNNCKYGYAAHRNVLRLSLLRSPRYPDPQADQGKHQFRFALYPHTGNPQSAGVTEQAYRFNVPLITVPAGGPDIEESFFSIDPPGMILDTIKKAEDSDALIVRLYESRGIRGKLHLTSALPVQSAMLVNLLEDEIAPLDWQNGTLELDFSPFEIITAQLGF